MWQFLSNKNFWYNFRARFNPSFNPFCSLFQMLFQTIWKNSFFDKICCLFFHLDFEGESLEFCAQIGLRLRNGSGSRPGYDDGRTCRESRKEVVCVYSVNAATFHPTQKSCRKRKCEYTRLRIILTGAPLNQSAFLLHYNFPYPRPEKQIIDWNRKWPRLKNLCHPETKKSHSKVQNHERKSREKKSCCSKISFPSFLEWGV